MADMRNSNFSLNSTFENVNSCTKIISENPELQVFILVVYAVVIVVGLVGNALILHIVVQNRPLQSSTNLFIANMALCDIGIVCVMVPKRISEVLTEQLVWLIPGIPGQVLCKMVPFLHDVFSEGSTYSLLLITADRFIAVVLPHKRWLSSKFVVCSLILSTWIASASVNAVILATFHLVKSKQNMLCVFKWDRSHDEFLAYVFTMITIHFVFPMFFIPAAYASIFITMKQRFVVLRHSISNQNRLQDLLRQRRVVILAFAIVCGFLVCWSPLAVQGILRFTVFFNYEVLPCSFQYFQESSHYFLVFISVTNPLICFTFGAAFKESLKRLTRRVCGIGRASINVARTEVELEIERLDQPAR